MAILQDSNAMLVVIDEMGIGTHSLNKYGYSKIG